MSDSIERIHLTVGEVSYPLGPLENVKDLEAQVLGATRAGGGFVKVTTDAGQRLSIFVSSASSLLITSDTVTLDGERADGSSDMRHTHHSDVFGDDESPYDYI